MRIVFALIGMFLCAGMAQAQDAGLITKVSPHNVAVTAAKLQTAVENAGAAVFGVVNHQKGAEAVGLELSPSTVVIFGNPKLGTPLIQTNPDIALDLPMKVLITNEGTETKVIYLSPGALKARYGVVGVDPVFEKMTGALDKFTDAAIAE